VPRTRSTPGRSRGDGEAGVGSRATVHLPGEPPREIALEPGASAEIPGAVRLLGSDVPGVVVEPLRAPARVDGERVAPGERRLLPPGRAARAGGVRVVAAWEPPGTATGARALLRAALRREPPATGAAFVALSGPAAGRRLRLRSGVLGRGRSAAIRVDDPAASRSHARVEVDGDVVRVTDLGSRNGTWIGGARVSGMRRLRPGARLRAGRTVLVLGLSGPGAGPAAGDDRRVPATTARALLLTAGAALALAAALLAS
jgi:hypothetical protein